MTPIISIVGKSDSGKTTLLTKLLPEIKRRGYRVATVKHDAHSHNLDTPGKDSFRHSEAGADAVVISGPGRLTLFKSVEHDHSLEEISELLDGEVDLVISEGYKRGDKPKIEVCRAEVSTEMLCGQDEVFAVVTDLAGLAQALSVPVFGLEDVGPLADLVEAKFLLERAPVG